MPELYLRVPKDRLENLKYRRRLLGARKPQRDALLHYCKTDILFWINSFVFQYNPNSIGTGSPELGPFITWDYQDQCALQLLDAIESRQDIVIEKSREMGASWLCLLVFAWLYLFHDWKKFLIISRSADAVDLPGDPDSLFWKLDFIFEHLPEWMTQGRLDRKKMIFVNPLTHSTLIGQASTGKAGVGGRATAIFVDEFSMIKEDFYVLQRTANTSNCRIFNGTHLGTDTAFYSLTARVDIRKLTMHWSQHPDKQKGAYRFNNKTKRVDTLDPNYSYPPDFTFITDGSPAGGIHPSLRSPWYDQKCKDIGSPRAVATDLDINPQGSVSQFVEPLLVNLLIDEYASDPYWTGDLNYDRESGEPISDSPLVPRADGRLHLWLHPHQGRPAPALYGVGADIAEGTGASPSCLSIVNLSTGEKVGAYVNPFIPPEQLAPLAVALCRLFASPEGTPARFCWEMQGPGKRFGRCVCDLGFRNFYKKVQDVSLRLGKYSDTPGWYPSLDNRKYAMEDYRSALISRKFVNRCSQSLKDLLDFRYDARGFVEWGGLASDDLSGAGVNHGDRPVSDSLAWLLVVESGKLNQTKKKSEAKVAILSLEWRRQYHEAREKELEYG